MKTRGDSEVEIRWSLKGQTIIEQHCTISASENNSVKRQVGRNWLVSE
jgi:hypothetical protein